MTWTRKKTEKLLVSFFCLKNFKQKQETLRLNETKIFHFTPPLHVYGPYMPIFPSPFGRKTEKHNRNK